MGYECVTEGVDLDLMIKLETIFQKGKRLLLAMAALAGVLLVLGCSSTGSAVQRTAVPESPAPPTVDMGATVDALVAQRLAEANQPTAVPTATTGAPTANPEDATPEVGDTETPTPEATLAPTATPEPTPTPGPTSTPTIIDDHGDDPDSATVIDSGEVLVVVLGVLETLEDVDYFEFTDAVVGQIWVFTPEYVPPETTSNRYPALAIDGSTVIPDVFTGIISVVSDGETIFLSVTNEIAKKTGSYRIVIDRAS